MGRVVVAGSINMDVVATASRHPRVGETVAGHAVHYFPDGKGANRNARLFMGARKSPVALTPGSDAAQPPAEIGVDAGDLVLPRHHGLGPMTGTQLDPILRNLGVTTIVGVGVSVNVGMMNFAFDAVNLGYQFVMPRDAVAGVPAEYADAVIENTLSLVATLTTTAEVVAAWENAPHD